MCLSKLRRKFEKEDDANEDSMKINKIASDRRKILNNEISFEKIKNYWRGEMWSA